MSTISAAIYELFHAGKTPSEIFRLLKPRVSRSGVYKVLKRLRETGCALPKVRSTPNRRVRTPNLIKKTREKIEKNPDKSIRKLAKAANVSYGTMRTILKNDLNVSPFKESKAEKGPKQTKYESKENKSSLEDSFAKTES